MVLAPTPTQACCDSTPELNLEHFGQCLCEIEGELIEVLEVRATGKLCHCILHFQLYSFLKKLGYQRN